MYFSDTSTPGLTTEPGPQESVVKVVRNRLKVRRKPTEASKDRPNSDAIKHIFVKGQKQPNQVIRSRIPAAAVAAAAAAKPQDAPFENSDEIIVKNVVTAVEQNSAVNNSYNHHNNNNTNNNGIIRSRVPATRSQEQVLKISETYPGTEGAVENRPVASSAPRSDDGPAKFENRILTPVARSQVVVHETKDEVIDATAPAAATAAAAVPDVIQDRIDVVEEQPSVRLRVVELEMFRCHRGCMLSKNSLNASTEADEDDLLIQQVKTFLMSSI